MLQLDFDPHSVCRICLSADDKLGNLFLSTVVDGYILAVPKMVSICLDMKVIPSDGLPDKLCAPCKLELTNFYRFKQKSKRTDTVLRSMIPVVEPLVEECSEQPDNCAGSDVEPSLDGKTSVQKPLQDLPVEFSLDPPGHNCQFCDMEFTTKDLLLQHIIDDHSKTPFVGVNIKTESADTSDLLKILDGPSELDEERRADYESFEVLFDDQDGCESNRETTAAEALVENDETEFSDTTHQVAGSEMMDYEELDEPSDGSPAIFGCGQCEEFFEMDTELDEHTKTVHSSMKCNNCHKEFTRMVQFTRHNMTCRPKQCDEDDTYVPDKEEYSEEQIDSDGTQREEAFECGKCSKTFTNQTKLKSHYRTNHSKAKRTASAAFSPITCPFVLCDSQPFKTQILYDQHVKMHEHINVFNNYITFYPCHTCRLIFDEAKDLQSHMIEQHDTFPKPEKDTDSMGDESCTDYQFLDEDGYEDGEYRCAACDETFNTSNETKHHIVIMHLDKFTCPEPACGCQYDQFARFSLHIVTKHINGNSHRCTHCDQEQGNYDALQSHMRNDCEQRKFACTHCEKRFFSKKALCHHMAHIKGKRYTCQYCGKSFTQQGELTIHLRTHTGERPFVCTVCGKAYKTSSMRTAHMDTHIPGKTFSCPICSKMLQTRTSYRNHLKRHTQEKKHACQYCEKHFFTKYHVNLHISKIHEKYGPHAEMPISMFDLVAPSEDDEDALANV